MRKTVLGVHNFVLGSGNRFGYSLAVACVTTPYDIQFDQKSGTTVSSTEKQFHPRLTSAASSQTPAQMGVISSAERKFIAAVGLAICILTSLPYIAGYVLRMPGQSFDGFLVHDADTYNYLAYARQSAQGQWLFHNPMTGEPHGDVFFNLEWLIIGKVSRWLHLSLPLSMNVLRVICIGLMCYSGYWLSTFVLHDIWSRRLALIAAMAGGGFGWIATLHLFHVPINASGLLDISVANFFPFHWALKLPHFLIAQSVAVLGLCFFLRAEGTENRRDYFYAGLCYIAAGACRPYDMLYLMAATGIFSGFSFSRKSGRDIEATICRTIPILMCVPLLGYYFWIFKIHPVFRWWTLPGCVAPPISQLALSYGIFFFALPPAIWFLLRRKIAPSTQFVICCLGTAVLLHLHGVLAFPFQFATSILVPLVIVVLAGSEDILKEARKRWRWAGAAIIALIFANSLTSIALLGQALIQVKKGDFRSDRNLLIAYSWLDKHSRSDDLVLADFENSNHIPRYTHNRVFCGYLNTVRLVEKGRAMNEFLRPGASDNFREHLVRENGIRFVLLTTGEEKVLSNGTKTTLFKEVFRNDAAVILAVSDAGSDPHEGEI